MREVSSSGFQAFEEKVNATDGADVTDMPTIETAIDSAQQNGQWLILFFHRVDDDRYATNQEESLNRFNSC